MKIIENIKSYAYRRQHLYKLDPVFVDGTRYNVISVTPRHTEEIPKKAKGLLAYLITGSKK